MGISLTLRDLDEIMTFFDRNRDGSISREELMIGLQGEMSPKRLAWVHLVYDEVLDVNKDGLVTLEDLLDKYDFSFHPKASQNNIPMAIVILLL